MNVKQRGGIFAQSRRDRVCFIRSYVFTVYGVSNYLKFVLDGLTAARIIKDDNYTTIELRLKGVCDKQGMTEIFVEEI